MRLRKGGRECRDDYCCGLHGSMVDRVGRYDIIGYGVFLDELAFGLLLLVSCCLLDVEVRCSLPIRRLTRGDTSRHYFVR